MKCLPFLFSLFLLPGLMLAQDGISFQAVARDNAGVPMANQLIQVRFGIHEGSSSGPLAYQESHSLTTDNFGLFSLNIGTGTPLLGTFNAIPWEESSPYFLKVEVDPGGGFVDMGTTELKRVPLAYHAESADKVKDAYLHELQDVNNDSPIAGHVLRWDGTEWASSKEDSSRWDGSGNDIHYSQGKVGIGTNTPTKQLHVKGGPMFADFSDWKEPVIYGRNVSPTSGYLEPTQGTIGVAGLAASDSSNGKFGILGMAKGNVGAVYGVSGSATGSGSNLYGVNGHVVYQSGNYSTHGVRGSAFSFGSNRNYGGYFLAMGSNTSTNYGVFGSASGATKNYAGYFDNGDVVIENHLEIGKSLTIDSLSGTGKRNVLVTSDGKLIASASDTMLLSIPGNAFVVTSTLSDVHYIAGEAYIEPGSSNFQYLESSLTLPHLATITKVTCYFKDEASANLEVKIRYNTLGANSSGLMAYLVSSGSSGYGNVVDTSINDPVIDLRNRHYLITASVISASSWPSHWALSLEAIVIEYTLP